MKYRQEILKIPSLWEAALETVRICFSKVILESNVTHNISRSSDSFSTVSPIINGGDWECIVHDMETIIVLVLLAFNFIPQRSHHSLTLPSWRFRPSALTPLNDPIDNKMKPSAWPISLFSRIYKSFKVYRRDKNDHKTLPCRHSWQRLPIYSDNRPI